MQFTEKEQIHRWFTLNSKTRNFPLHTVPVKQRIFAKSDQTRPTRIVNKTKTKNTICSLSLYVPDTSVTLKHSQDYQIWCESMDPKWGYITLQSLKDLTTECPRKKTNINSFVLGNFPIISLGQEAHKG